MATGSAFQSLYDNVNGIQTAFGDFWEYVAKKFANNQNVVGRTPFQICTELWQGYELINEPWPGDVYEHPSLILKGGAADVKNLQPMYDYLK